ncbi:assimilatory sulfite reductase [Phellopilus nigrolimitatus]|nr:assimilatory sulfite reductase [Phellopilus nigrolimitatus]
MTFNEGPQTLAVPASTLIEKVVSNNSSSVFVYDLAEHVDFGVLTKEWCQSGEGNANVVTLQTRAGAGLSLIGRLSEEGTSKDAQKDSVLTAYNTLTGLAAMAPTFAFLPTANGFSPSLASLSTILNTLPDSFAVLLSSSPQESVDLAVAAYSITKSHVIHVFDHYSAGREIGETLVSKPVTNSPEVEVQDALKAAGYAYFDYSGDANASVVLVALNGPLASTAKAFVKNKPGLGVVVVRVLRPWDDALFLAALPSFVKTVHILDEVPTEGTQGALYMDVFAAVIGSRTSKTSKTAVRAIRVVPTRAQEFMRLLFFGTPSSPLANLPRHISNTFLANKAIRTRTLTDYDVFSKPGGLHYEEYVPVHAHLPLGGGTEQDANVDFLAVLDQSLLKSHSILSNVKQNAVVLLFSSWSASEVLANLQTDVLTSVRKKNVKIYIVDAEDVETDGLYVQDIIGHLAFLRLYLGPAANEALLRSLAHEIYGNLDEVLNIDKINAKAWAALAEVSVPPTEEQADGDAGIALKSFEFNAVNNVFSDRQSSLPGAHLSPWHDAARHILFPDAFTPSDEVSPDDEYPQNPALRPEVPDRTFLVTCSVNRRLTPLEYDRNVFHLEFDTSGTGLKYAIGEALGVHGWNDTDEVLEFCTWYEGKVHTRTVFQALQQQIDLFGKPPKSFYADLAEYATTKNNKLSLQFIGSAEGSSTFKKLTEKDTVSFCDILQKYKSARPSIELLCDLIGDIKPRHYSIASAQSVVGDRVDLLVVTVEWATPSGSPRYGQCTRYLAGLKVGQNVTVSIKPSVMKLPPDDLQPLILAGLGTGAAPFRAFLQHRAWLATQGKPVGPLYYYFGSRYRSKEYLYGEEIEAFILDKTITRAGLAFSRDDRKKVYIQHKMVEDAEALARMLHTEKGVFYLCGPTWPVPDVYEALVTALVKYNGLEEKAAGDYLEGLKEEERYVLEVY